MPASAPVIRRTLGAAFALIVAGPALAPSSADACVRPFLLGDSVLAWSTSVLRRELGHSAPVVDAAACRGTVYSCVSPGQSGRPASGLSALRSQRGRLGELVVIELGYNDRPLRASIDRILGELRSQGVKRVFWVNLSERRAGYRDTNRALDAAAARWPELRILDWRTMSARHGSWFTDGIHLTAAGKSAFVRFLGQALNSLH